MRDKYSKMFNFENIDALEWLLRCFIVASFWDKKLLDAELDLK